MRALPLVACLAGPVLTLCLSTAAVAQPVPAPPPPTAPAGAAPAQPPDVQSPSPQVATDATAPTVVPPATLKVTGASGLVLHAILPAATGDFELVMSKFFEAVAKVGDDTQRRVAAGWKVARVAEGAPGGVNALYAFVVDPAVPDADYSGTFILEMIYKAFPDDAPDLHRKFVAAYAGPRHVLNLTPLLPAPLAPAVPPPAPK